MKTLIPILLLSIISLTTSKMSRSEFVSKLEKLAKEPSKYRMKYPYNLLYWDGSKWWCDCSNLLKALFNGRDINDKTKGSYQRVLKDPPDVNADSLINLCSSLSSDFSKLRNGEPRLIHMKGHIGTYIGKELQVAAGIVNVIECTGALGGGIKYTYVDSHGNRLTCKGCSRNLGRWTKHGLPSRWVS